MSDIREDFCIQNVLFQVVYLVGIKHLKLNREWCSSTYRFNHVTRDGRKLTRIWVFKAEHISKPRHSRCNPRTYYLHNMKRKMSSITSSTSSESCSAGTELKSTYQACSQLGSYSRSTALQPSLSNQVCSSGVPALTRLEHMYGHVTSRRFNPSQAQIAQLLRETYVIQADIFRPLNRSGKEDTSAHVLRGIRKCSFIIDKLKTLRWKGPFSNGYNKQRSN